MMENIKAGLVFLCIFVPYVIGVISIIGSLFHFVGGISCTLS